MLLLFVDSALRRTEVVNLVIGEIGLENRQVRVLAKGNKVGGD